MAPFWVRLLPQQLGRHLEGRPLVQRLIHNAGWLIGDKLVRLALGLITSAWIARYLGPTLFGLYAFGQILVVLYSGLATLGLPDIVLRDLVRHPDDQPRIAASAFILRIIGAAIATAIIALTVVISRPHDMAALYICMIFATSLFPQSMDVVDLRYQSITNVRLIVVLRNIVFVAMSGVKIAAVLMHASIAVLAAAFTLEYLIVAVLMYVAGRMQDRAFRLADARLREMGRQLREAWPLCLRLICIGIYMRIDQVFIQHLLGDRAVGIYSAATRVSELWYFVPTAAVTALMPSLTQHYQSSVQAYEDRLLQVMRYLAWTGMAAGLSISLLSRVIVGVLYGSKYIEAAGVLAVHAWVGIFVAIGVAASSWFVNAGLLRYGLYQAVAGAAISVIMNLILIPRFGLIGAAFAALVSYASSAFLLNALHPSTRRLFYIQLRALTFR